MSERLCLTHYAKVNANRSKNMVYCSKNMAYCGMNMVLVLNYNRARWRRSTSARTWLTAA